jgi:molybdopterin molybdotransferase
MPELVINGTNIPLDIKVLPAETRSVHEAAFRVAAEDVSALAACPSHSESLRDGYVLASHGAKKEGNYCFPVVGEIAAGMASVVCLAPGTACRIFTGGVIPVGGVRVVPQEECVEVAGEVRVAPAAMASKRLFINTAGSEVACGEMVVGKGTRLEIDHLTLLTAVGVRHVKVVSRPRVACYCTGSELVAMGGQPEVGQKLSLNSLLFQNLIPRYGGVVAEQGIIFDKQNAVQGLFAAIKEGGYDLAVSSGGMGPGKYDLVKKAFGDAGGKIILQTLAMQPGRSTLLGTLGKTVFIALPGPPHAVRTLINELVGPVLLWMQGASSCRPVALSARLGHDYRVKKTDLLQVKGGVPEVREGICTVRLAERLEPISCYVLFPPGKKEFKAGEAVEVHLLPGCAGGALHL